MEKRVDEIIRVLGTIYPNPQCELDFSSPYELLVATILSAQCTDKRVNLVTKKLFSQADTPGKMIQLGEEELSKKIYSCGFYRNKAANIIAASHKILTEFGGKVPQTVEELSSLPGVGRKTANVVFSNAFGGQAIAVDTHVFRVSNRLRLAKAVNVLETEKQLMQVIEKPLWSKAHHLFVLHGRYTCKSQKPSCGNCAVSHLCDFIK